MLTNHPNALKYALQALAQPSDFQHRLLSVWREDVSELCERFVQAERHFVHHDKQPTSEQQAALKALHAQLLSFSGPTHAEHWRQEALDRSACWAEVRKLAARCLAAFAWPITEPPLEIAAYGEDCPQCAGQYSPLLAAIERHCNLVLPASYRRWACQGYFTFGSLRYLWAWEAEWLPVEQVPSCELSPFPHLAGLVPFAFTGGGDPWCWQVGEPTGSGEYRILRCAHDSDRAEVYAPSFAGWFYRLCLTYACCVEKQGRAIEQARTHLILWADRLAELAQTSWADDLRRLAARSPARYHWGPRQMPEHGFLTFDDCDERVRQALGREYLNQEIPWQG